MYVDSGGECLREFCRRFWEGSRAREEHPAWCRGHLSGIGTPDRAVPSHRLTVIANACPTKFGLFFDPLPPKSPCREVFVRRFCCALFALLRMEYRPRSEHKSLRMETRSGDVANDGTKVRVRPLPHPWHRDMSEVQTRRSRRRRSSRSRRREIRAAAISVISAFVVIAAFAAAVLVLGPLNQARVAPLTTGSEAVIANGVNLEAARD